MVISGGRNLKILAFISLVLSEYEKCLLQRKRCECRGPRGAASPASEHFMMPPPLERRRFILEKKKLSKTLTAAKGIRGKRERKRKKVSHKQNSGLDNLSGGLQWKMCMCFSKIVYPDLKWAEGMLASFLTISLTQISSARHCQAVLQLLY